MSAPPLTTARLLTSVRLHARLLALWMGELWRRDRTSPDQGLAITAGEVERLLEDPSELEASRRAFMADDPETQRLAPAAAAAEQALAADPGWRRLTGGFDLSAPEADLLALALALAWDPGLGRVYAYLQDDTQAQNATALLASRLFRRSPAAPRNLLRWRLVQPLDGQVAGLPGAAWSVDPAVALSLGAEGWRDPALGGAARLASPQDIADWPPLHTAALDELAKAAQTASPPVQFDLCGAEGSGRQTLALRFAETIERPLLVVDTARLLVDTARKAADQITAVQRMARVTGAVVLWRDAQLLPIDAWKPARALADLALCAWPSAGPAGAAGGARQITVGAIQTRDRLKVWSLHSDRPAPALVATQRLNPGEVAEAARVSSAGPAAVRAALRKAAPIQDDLLSLVPTPYGWDDLVAPPEMTRQLREFAAQISLRWPVYEDWGYERLTHLGRGLAALFGGPSGVGKTMAAQVIARELDLDLYRVDLAGVINKYIGETEKRLRSVFDYCERAGCILFFDEADALFGSRMQVKDAHDRFANIEIDYLLQRIERFDGVTILATNRKNDLDSAFLRRLRVIIDFMPPGPDERLLLWKKALIPVSPGGETILDPIDWDFLAERLALTGADIKSAALGAAFLAKAAGTRVGMEHVLAAVQREMTKHGQVLRTPLKEARS